MKKKQQFEKLRPGRDLLSTGSTLLNLGCTGDLRGGFAKGLYFFLVGDSQSGKTWLSLTCFAEASINPDFSEYRFIFDDAENGALMDIKKYFGEQVAARVEPPAYDKKGRAEYSRYSEEFYGHLYSALRNKQPCIYVMDSMDALTSAADSKKMDALEKGKELKGDYGDGKAKLNSRMLRSCVADLRDTGSILIVINQTRDNINAGLFESKKTRSGGRALTFYATLELWSAVGQKIKRTVKGKPRIVGITSRVHIKKNRLVGKDRVVDVPILYAYGIDDISGCINFLIENDQWNRNSQGIIDSGADLGLEPMKERKLIREIEKQGLELDLRYITAECWNSIERELEESRKPRYL